MELKSKEAQDLWNAGKKQEALRLFESLSIEDTSPNSSI